MSSRIFAIALVPCVTLGLWLGCKTVEETPLPPSQYELPSRSITNGVSVFFSAAPPQDLIVKMESAGALRFDDVNGVEGWLFPTVDTEARRLAVNAALLAGATLKGTP